MELTEKLVEQNLCLSSIKTNKSQFYPEFEGKEIEYSLFDIVKRRISQGLINLK